MDSIALNAKDREILGKKVKTLRTQGLMPGVVFGKDMESAPITIDTKEFLEVYNEVGESGLIYLKVGSDKSINVIVSDIDRHPVSDGILHVNLRQVSLTEKITAPVPIIVEGESAAVKSGEGIVLQVMQEIEVTCLPQDIPQEIILDISGLNNIDDALHVSDLPIDMSKIEVHVDQEDIVVKIDYAQQPETEDENELTEEELVEGVEATQEKEADDPDESKTASDNSE